MKFKKKNTGNNNPCSIILMEKRGESITYKDTIGLNHPCSLLEEIFESLLVIIDLCDSKI